MYFNLTYHLSTSSKKPYAIQYNDVIYCVYQNMYLVSKTCELGLKIKPDHQNDKNESNY